LNLFFLSVGALLKSRFKMHFFEPKSHSIFQKTYDSRDINSKF
jgi:hypothetical protein